MSHSLTKLLFHCTFSTDGRRAILTEEISRKVNAYMAGIVRNIGAHLIRAGGTADHRHLLLELKPTANIADVQRVTKCNSSKWLHETFPATGNVGWQRGYAAFTVSESARERVIAYIDNQGIHHGKMSFEEELALLLARHRVQYETDDLSG